MGGTHTQNYSLRESNEKLKPDMFCHLLKDIFQNIKLFMSLHFPPKNNLVLTRNYVLF